MKLTRREFLLLTAGFAAGCRSTENPGMASAGSARVVNAGPASNYAQDGVYAGFRNMGFFIIRQNGRLFALSSVCTHRHCQIKAERDHSFYCPCHGSTFNPNGQVTHGPAQRNLPVLPTATDEGGQLLVTVPTA